MEKRLDNNGYIDFPFPATRNADGSVNPCGFDLTLETGRLEEIAVLNHSVNLRRLVEEINLQEGLFITLAAAGRCGLWLYRCGFSSRPAATRL